MKNTLSVTIVKTIFSFFRNFKSFILMFVSFNNIKKLFERTEAESKEAPQTAYTVTMPSHSPFDNNDEEDYGARNIAIGHSEVEREVMRRVKLMNQRLGNVIPIDDADADTICLQDYNRTGRPGRKASFKNIKVEIHDTSTGRHIRLINTRTGEEIKFNEEEL